MNKRLFCGKLATILAAVLPALVHPNAAVAEESPSDGRADVLFSRALLLMKSDQCPIAISVFLESQKADPAAATLANVATCYERLGKTASAFVTYQEAARMAAREQDHQLQKRIEQVLAGLRPRLTRIRITPIGTSTQPLIRINGHQIEDFSDPIPLDPGENVIEATAPGRQAWRRTLSANAEGTLIVVEVPELSVSRAASRSRPLRTPLRNGSSRDGASAAVDLKPFAIIATGIGATAIAVGTALGLSARSRRNASTEYCDGHFCTETGSRLRQDAAERAELATWSVGIGLVSTTAALVLWVAAGQRDRRRAQLGLLPEIYLGQSSAGAALSGAL